MFKIKYSKRVKNDLKVISDFISMDNPIYSIQIIYSITKTIDMLEDFPYIWKEIEKNIRELIESKYKYKIVYQIDNNTITILSVYKYKNSWE